MEKFGQSLEIIPRTIAENAGHKAEELIASLYAECHKSKTVGIDVEQGAIKEVKVYDSFEVKSWAIKLAVDAVLTILKIDQVCSNSCNLRIIAHHGQACWWTQDACSSSYGRRG